MDSKKYLLRVAQKPRKSSKSFLMLIETRFDVPCIVLGDPRTNQNPALVTFGILLLRWHNVVAARVHKQHPDWDDEQLFQRARRIVIASLQVTVLN